jgi:hypothetical protein
MDLVDGSADGVSALGEVWGCLGTTLGPGGSMHGNARLTPVGRLTMVMRIEAGRPVTH